MAETKKLPLVVAGDRDVLAQAREADAFYGEAGQDVTFVGGYSNVRRENVMRKRKGERQVMPKVRLQWARASTPSGKPDGRDIAWLRAQGYRFVPQDTADLGIAAPASGQWNAAAQRWEIGDAALMYCPREVAARNENVLRRATEERSTADATASDLHAEGGRVGASLGQDMLTESTLHQELRSTP